LIGHDVQTPAVLSDLPSAPPKVPLVVAEVGGVLPVELNPPRHEKQVFMLSRNIPSEFDCEVPITQLVHENGLLRSVDMGK